MTHTPKSISKLFNKFVGKQLKNPSRMTCDVDTVYGEMEQVANDNGLKLRVAFPDSFGTCDYDLNRVNVSVDVDAAGRLFVGKKFHLG